MTNHHKFSRRSILKGMAASSILTLMGANISGCGSSSNNLRSSSYPPISDRARVSFSHGVASGDPLQDRVIIWTRATPDETGRVDLDWQLATDNNFDNIIASGSHSTDPDVDYTAKVDVSGLQAGQTYYYRFVYKQSSSTIGRTKTLPGGSIEQLSLAVFSCANFPAGYFHVYGEAAKHDYDAVIHLGDYIYEYAMGGYATEDAEALGRIPDPLHEAVSLDDYRLRYAQYRSDADLQALHGKLPFILVWDDHEVANDSWREGAENHNPDTEGSFAARKIDALQAYYEWLPIRPPVNLQAIYRSFRFGDLLDLFMLDTRLIGRDQQLDFADFTTANSIDGAAVNAAATASDRSLLGAEQKQWLLDQLNNSQNRWQVLGQQVLMGRMAIPSPILLAVNEQDVATGVDLIIEATVAKNKAPQDRTAEEQALLDDLVPYNLDAWDGYAAERDEVLNRVFQLNKKLVVLAGDTHNAWANQLRTQTGDIVGVELATASVSSPGFDDYLSLSNEGYASFFEGALVTLVDDLNYCNAYNRGYMVVTFTSEEVQSQWIYVDSVKTQASQINTARGKIVKASWSDLLLQSV
jgi:alkaline phosphatase D